jgi:hypothetical protein
MTNTVDRFYAALRVLTGEGSVKQRLIRAYADNLDDLDVSELPDELQERFAETHQRVHSVPPLNGEGAVRASVRKMSAQDASDCAHALLSIYAGMLESPGEAAASAGESPAPFLVKSASG